jgi:hypothetical protein
MPNDIFLSYAHLDNQPFGSPKGWVDHFLENLKVRVAQMLGSEPVIWSDKRLQGNQYFVGEIGDHISGSLLLTPVVTPRYVNSDWCRGELKEFCRRAHADAPMGNYSRVFKILKTPVAEHQLPEELRGLLGFKFYEVDENDVPREFRPVLGEARDQRYWDKLDDLAWAIKAALERLRDQPRATAAVLPLEKKVYLAETAPELNVQSDRIRRELQQHGYYVLPDKTLPSNLNDLEAAVREYVSRCELSIHLVGGRFEHAARFGSPSGLESRVEAEPPLVSIQLELAAERAQAGDGFERLIWLPPDLQTEDPRQLQFIKELKDNISAGTELLETSIEDLKLRVIKKLTAQPKLAAEGSDHASVYLIHDDKDVKNVAPIDEFLFDRGFEVILPIFDGDSAEVAQYHRESLLNCDGALIYHGSAKQPWLRSKISDLQKAREGRRSPLAATIYISAPQTAEKERFRTHALPVVHNFSAFSPDTLRPFLHSIEGANGGQRP